MLRETVRGWTQEWEQNGFREGRRTLVIRQLELKFGPLLPEDQARIEAADSEQLIRWGERILTATSLREVFESS